jgi:hypothetical protein
VLLAAQSFLLVRKNKNFIHPRGFSHHVSANHVEMHPKPIAAIVGMVTQAGAITATKDIIANLNGKCMMLSATIVPLTHKFPLCLMVLSLSIAEIAYKPAMPTVKLLLNSKFSSL